MQKILSAILIIAFCFLFASVSFGQTGGSAELTVLLSENRDPAQYTPESFALYREALTNALVVHENPAATEEEILYALDTLRRAKDDLVSIATKQDLAQCIANIDEILYDVNSKIPAETRQQLLEKRTEIQELLSNEQATVDAMAAAKSSCETLVLAAQLKREPVPEYSVYGENTNIVVPTDYASSPDGVGNVTRLRLHIFWIGAGFSVFGLIIVILYFILVKKQRNH